jgi:hypothetical protein
MHDAHKCEGSRQELKACARHCEQSDAVVAIIFSDDSLDG